MTQPVPARPRLADRTGTQAMRLVEQGRRLLNGKVGRC